LPFSKLTFSMSKFPYSKLNTFPQFVLCHDQGWRNLTQNEDELFFKFTNQIPKTEFEAKKYKLHNVQLGSEDGQKFMTCNNDVKFGEKWKR